jgi:hypothetical protein
MPTLDTSEKVIGRTHVTDLPQYTDLIPIADVPGFAVRRAYPAGSDLAEILNRDGDQLVKAIIQFIVEPSTASGGTSAVILRAWVFPRSKATRLFAGLRELSPKDPDAPTPDSLARWDRARKPSEVELLGQFIYDAGGDQFLDSAGTPVAPSAMLDRVYQAHLRTLQRSFVWPQKAESALHWLVRLVVFRGQAGLVWILLNRYDIELALPRDRISPFHRFKLANFVRMKIEPGGERSEFFGLVSSRKNLVTNLVVLALVASLMYCYAPRTGLLQAIYDNDALTTAALLLAFFTVDYFGQLVLKLLICGLSRLKEPVAFLPRWIRP